MDSACEEVYDSAAWCQKWKAIRLARVAMNNSALAEAPQDQTEVGILSFAKGVKEHSLRRECCESLFEHAGAMLPQLKPIGTVTLEKILRTSQILQGELNSAKKRVGAGAAAIENLRAVTGDEEEPREEDMAPLREIIDEYTRALGAKQQEKGKLCAILETVLDLVVH